MTEQEHNRRYLDRALRWYMLQHDLPNWTALANAREIHPNTIRKIRNRPNKPQWLIIDALISYCARTHNGNHDTDLTIEIP